MANDKWSSEKYVKNASFVANLGNPVIDLLDPQLTDHILDIGCGDGALTLRLAQRCASVLATDSSADMVSAATARGLDAQVIPAAKIGTMDAEQFDAVFSNAALHWILKDEEEREATFTGIHKVLKRNGRLTFEMGGFGNVAEVTSCLLLACKHAGIAEEDLRRAIPWWFPTAQQMTDVLTHNGFTVDFIELRHRPTELVRGQTAVEWLETFGFWALDLLPPDIRGRVTREVANAIEYSCKRETDGRWVVCSVVYAPRKLISKVNYMRLKVSARKV